MISRWLGLGVGCIVSSSVWGAFPLHPNTEAGHLRHPPGYTGVGGNVNITVCSSFNITPGTRISAYTVDEIKSAIQDGIDIVNAPPTGGANVVGGKIVRAEEGHPKLSLAHVVAHELLHVAGYGHYALSATELRSWTHPAIGMPNYKPLVPGEYTGTPGPDAICGTHDDDIGTGANRVWFVYDNNDPWYNAPVNREMYGPDIRRLPQGHTSPIIATWIWDRDLRFAFTRSSTSDLYGKPAQMSAVHSVYLYDVLQTTLSNSDYHLKMVQQHGLDRTPNTEDDYTYKFVWTDDSTCMVSIVFNDSGNLGSASSDWVNWSTDGDILTSGGMISIGSNVREWEMDWTVLIDGAPPERPAQIFQSGFEDQ